MIRGAELDCGGQPTAYTRQPQEIVNYASCHDNETLFDQVSLLALLSMSLWLLASDLD